MNRYLMQTYSGIAFDVNTPRPADVRIEDIDMALSKTCRFAGNTKYFYSVAEHSIHVFRAMDEIGLDKALDARTRALPLHMALLHDAAEAYMGDVPRPVKLLMTEWDGAERQIRSAIYEALIPGYADMVLRDPDRIEAYERIIDLMDDRVLVREATSVLKAPPFDDWHLKIRGGLEPVPFPIRQRDPIACSLARWHGFLVEDARTGRPAT